MSGYNRQQQWYAEGARLLGYTITLHNLPRRPTMSESTQTNEEFSLLNDKFKAACILENIPATRRQASKWRRQTGRAYKNLGKNKRELNEDILALKRDLIVVSTSDEPEQTTIDEIQRKLASAENLLARLR